MMNADSKERLSLMRTFAKKNNMFWRSLDNASIVQRKGFVLVPLSKHAMVTICDASLASIVASARQQKILFLAEDYSNKMIQKTLLSYPQSKVISIKSWRFSGLKKKSKVLAFEAFKAIETTDELLDYSIDDIRFGDALYDAVLAKGYATVDKIDKRTIKAFENFFFYRLLLAALRKKYDIRCAVLAHVISMKGAVFSRYFMRDKVEVINRVGSHQILIKKYQSLKDKGFYPVRPEQSYFDSMMCHNGDEILKMAEDYLERRFSRQIQHVAVDAAFDPDKKIYKDSASFCEDYGLNPNKPIVFVMLHAFNDYPNSHFSSKTYFNDYFDWFLKTLEYAKQNTEVNWVFKEHPAAKYYKTKDADLESIFECSEPKGNICFLGSEASFNTISLRFLAHALVTCLGRAGLEYTTLGVPCVLGAKCMFDGFGFTTEPKTLDEYKQCMLSIHKLDRLNEVQIRAAKVVSFFVMRIMDKAVYHFCPEMSQQKIMEWNPEAELSFWKEAGDNFDDVVKVRNMREQIQELGEFISNPSRTQYVNLKQYPFLNAVSSIK